MKNKNSRREYGLCCRLGVKKPPINQSILSVVIDRINKVITKNKSVGRYFQLLHWSYQYIEIGPPRPATDPGPLLYCLFRNRGLPIDEDERVQVLSNGSLRIRHVTTRDAGNYTCRAENKHGADEMTARLIVQGEASKVSVRRHRQSAE